MANFCGKCGTGLDKETGLCPNCDREQLNAMATQNVVASASNFCPHCGSTMDKQTGQCSNPNCSNGATNAFVGTVSQSSVENKPKKNKSKAWTTFVTSFLSVCLFITLFLAIVIFDVRNIVQEDNIEILLDNIQTTDLLSSTQAATDGDLERFYSTLSSKYGIEMEDEQLDDFIDDSTIKEFVADKISEFCGDYFKDEAELKITKKEVVNLIESNSGIIEDEFGVYLMDSEIEEIADWIMGRDERTMVIVSSTTLKDSAPALYYTSTIAFSYITMAVFIVLSALIIFLMIRNSFSQAVCGIGVDFIVLGCLFGLIAILMTCITYFSTTYADLLVGMFVGNFMVVYALISVILLVLGVIMLVIRRLVIKHHAKKERIL